MIGAFHKTKYYSLPRGFVALTSLLGDFSGTKTRRRGRLEPRGWISDGCILEEQKKIAKGLSTVCMSTDYFNSPSTSLSHFLSLSPSLSLPSSLNPALPSSLPLSPLPLPFRALRFAREKVPATYGDLL